MKEYCEHPISARTARWLTLGLCAGALSACSNDASNDKSSESLGRARQALSANAPDTSTLAAAAAFSGRSMGAAVDYAPLVNETEYASTRAQRSVGRNTSHTESQMTAVQVQ